MNTNDGLDPILQAKLLELQTVKQRDASATARGKNRFMAEAQQLAVTYTGLNRLNVWIDNLKTQFTRKEKAPMFTTIISVILVLATLLGGGGISVAAAQSSQPNDFLYPLKALSEDAYYQLTAGNENRLNLVLTYADRRMAEIQTMLEEGRVPDDAVQLRLQTHLQTALDLSVKNMSEADRLLEQIRAHLMQQLQTRLQQTNPHSTGEAYRLQVRNMVQTRIDWIDEGLKQLTQLRQQTQLQAQTGGSGDQVGSGNQGTGSDSVNAGQMTGNQYGSGGQTFRWSITPTPYYYQNQYQNQNGQGGSGSGMGKK